MLQRNKKVIAAMLALSMLWTSTPLPVFAESSEAETEVVDVQSTAPEAQSAGIKVEMLTAAKVCSSVQFQVVAPGAESYWVNWYDGDRVFIGSAEYALTDGIGTFGSWVDVASTEIIEVGTEIDGVVYTDEIRVVYTSQGKFQGVPVITNEEMPRLKQPYTLSWNPVEGASKYYIYLKKPDGQVVQGNMAGTSLELAVDMLGNYTFRVAAICEGYEQGDFAEKTFTASGPVADNRVAISVPDTDVVYGEIVEICVSAPGAECVALYYADQGYEWLGEGNSFTFEYWAERSQYVCGAARYDGTWVYGDLVKLNVTNYGQLDTPILQMQDSYGAGEMFTVSWSAVEHVETYGVRICNQQGEVVCARYGLTDTSWKITEALEAGNYTLVLETSAEGWKTSMVEREFSVTGSLMAGPELTVNTNQVIYGNQVNFSVSMEGAERFQLYSNGQSWDYPAENGVATFSRTLYGNPGDVIRYQVRAYVNGKWTAYGPAVEITLLDLPTLDKAQVIVPTDAHAGDDIEISWTAVKNAQRYTVSVENSAGESLLYDYVSGEETSAVISAGRIKQGQYKVVITAIADGYYNGVADAAVLNVFAPLPGKEYRYSTNSNGTVYLYDYLGDPVPSEVVIPEKVDGMTVTDIGNECFDNAQNLKNVTIPASVTYISTTAFAGAANLTICGYTASAAESYAIVNGYNFVALDDGEGDITASWTGPALVNGEVTFEVHAPGATEVRMYCNGSKTGTAVLTEGGAKVTMKCSRVETCSVRFEAKVNDVWLTTKNYKLEVISYGEMPKVTDLTAASAVVEPGSPITISWTAPAGVEAAEYSAGIQKPGKDTITWFSVPAGDTTYTFSSYWVGAGEGTCTLWVEVEGQPGYEASLESTTVEMKSSKIWDFLAEDYKIIGYHGTERDVVIPDEIDGVAVKYIGSDVFKGSDITSVVVPEGVRSIYNDAFASCESLTSVSLPSTLEYIMASAFEGCEKLTDITLPDGLRTLGNYAFEGCTALTAIEIPEKITSIGLGVFYGCKALSQVTLPEGLVSIESYAFYGCNGLKEITIPQGVTDMDDSAFRGCYDLTIYGYTGSAAETFAQEQGFEFVALDSVNTGDISFELVSNRVYANGKIQAVISAPDAEKVRLYVGDEFVERNMYSSYNGKVTVEQTVTSTGTYQVRVAQCVDGQWLAPCAAQTVTVVQLGKPVLEPISGAVANEPVTVRWMPVEGAVKYTLRLYEDNVKVAEYQDITTVDEAGYVYHRLTAADVAHKGTYNVDVYAYAADGGYSYGECYFETKEASAVFAYELDENGFAIVTGYTGDGEEVTVPATLDGYTVARIAPQAFRNCAQLKMVKIPEGCITIAEHAFADCPVLMALYLGAGVFVEHGAFADCRSDMVVCGYSGGNVEQEALEVCQFFSLGELEKGPEIIAEDIWNNESLTYEVSCEGAAKLYIQEIYPNGHVDRYIYNGSSVEGKPNISFAYDKEDSVVWIQAAALIDGVWTAFAKEDVEVRLANTLDAPVINEIGRLARHLDHTISWEHVEHAEQYQVLVFNKNKIALSLTLDGAETSVSFRAGELFVCDDSSISVTAVAEGYWESSATAVFQVYEQKLDMPELMVDELILRHQGAEISWREVPNAQWYVVTVADKAGDTYLYEEEKVRDTKVLIEADDLEPDHYVVTVRACATYWVDSDRAEAEFEVREQKLDTPEITVEARIARHLGAVITWDDVAEWYTVTVVSKDGEHSLCNERYANEPVLNLSAAVLEPDVYTVLVTAHAAYYQDSDPASAEFEIYLAELDAPVVTVPETVVGGVPFTVGWQSVADAQGYRLEIFDVDGEKILHNSYYAGNLEQDVYLEEYLREGTLTVRITASASYRADGVTEKVISYKPLYSYQVVGGNAVITAYNGTQTRLWVPGRILDYPVTAIGDGAFEANGAIEEVFLPDSVTQIGAMAFKNCTALKTVIGDGVKSIGDEAFLNCTNLSFVRFNAEDMGVVIGQDSFTNTPIVEEEDLDGLLDITLNQTTEDANGTSAPVCSNNLFVTEAVYKEGFTTIPAKTHYNNLRLRQVYLPESMRWIGSEAFGECPQLDYVKIHDGVTFIAEDAFRNSPNVYFCIYTSDMSQVSYAEQYAIDHNIPYDKVFWGGNMETADSDVVVKRYEEGMIHIPQMDQYENSHLETVYLPESVKTIGSEAFAYCGALQMVDLYDGIEQIADDAFKGSSQVAFILHVDHLEEISYPEQFALDHNIPYQKYQKLADTEEKIDVGDGVASAVRVKVDLPVEISISDIPSEADWLVIYLDGEPIREMAVSQTTETYFVHTFREFGDHLLTAEAFQNGEQIKLSWKKPVIVTGIRVRADRQTAWTGEIVHFVVEAFSDEATALLYAEDMFLGEVKLTDGVGTYAYAFTKAGNREISTRTYSGLMSEVLNLPVLCVGVLDQPVLEAELIQFVEEGILCSWATTENADGYVLRVRHVNGEEIAYRNIEDDGSERMSCLIPAEEIPGVGSYQLYLMNYGARYDQNESDTVTVQMVEAGVPGFTMDKDHVATGEVVNFTFRAYGASEVELWVDGQSIETIGLTNGKAEFARSFTKSGNREIAIRALRDGEWTELTAAQILQVTSLGQLDEVLVQAEPVQLWGNAICASWSAVNHAEGYVVYFRNEAGQEIYRQETDQLKMEIPGEMVPESGEYYFLVVAYGTSYDQSEGSAYVAVMDHLPGPVILTPGANEVCGDLAVTLNWEAVTGAEYYVVSLARKTGEVDANGQPIYEKVWAAPNETVQVGSDLRYDLTGLAYGEEYRVAVGAVVTLENGQTSVGWSEQIFRVEIPTLEVRLSGDVEALYEKQELTLTAIANHKLTKAVLTDENGAPVNILRSESKITEEGRVFTFVVTETQQCRKTYTVTVSGTDELASVQSATASLTVDWLDADTPAVNEITMEPANLWPGMDAVFTIKANCNTVKLDVYWVENGQETLVTTLEPVSVSEDANVFRYERVFDAAGNYQMRFAPLNAYNEWTTGEYITCTVLPLGKLPDPEVTNLSQGDIVPKPGYKVTWNPVELAESMLLGGYSVTVYSWDEESGWWKPMSGQHNVFIDQECSYVLPDMVEGGSYRIEVYTVSKGETLPSEELSGCTWVEFTYGLIPEFGVTAIETEGIQNQPVTVSWEAPFWKLVPETKPDRYVVHWYRVDSEQGTVAEIYGQELEGDALTATLPGEIVDRPGEYLFAVYALLGTQQRVHTGDDSFVIVPPEVEIAKPDGQTTWMDVTSLEIQGTVKGGVTSVLVRLVDVNGNVVAVRNGNSAANYVMATVADGTFAAKLDMVNALTASDGNVADYEVQVYGFLEGQDLDISAPADSDTWQFLVGKPEISKMTLNNTATAYWLFADEWMTARVTANRAVTGLQFYDNGVKKDLKFAYEDQADGSRVFTSDSFNISQGGLHKIKVTDANDENVFKSMDLYVVTRTAKEDVQASTVAEIRSLPNGNGRVITMAERGRALVKYGVFGDYVYVIADGTFRGFIHKDALMEVAVIEYPFADAQIDITTIDKLDVQWQACPGAVRYRVILTVTVTGKNGDPIDVSMNVNVTATEDEIQTATFDTMDILMRVSGIRAFGNTTWPATIGIEAYGN